MRISRHPTQQRPTYRCHSRSLPHPASNQTGAVEVDSTNVTESSDARDGASRDAAAMQNRLGAVMFSDHVWQRIGERLNLSPRERQILLHLFDDEKETVIATHLGISPHTVHMHIERLYRKLDVGGRMNMALRVVETFFRLCIDPREQLPPICRNHADGSCPLRS